MLLNSLTGLSEPIDILMLVKTFNNFAKIAFCNIFKIL